MPPFPSIKNFTSLLHKCTHEKSLACVLCIHTHIYKYGLEPHKSLGNQIVSMFVEAGSICASQDNVGRLGVGRSMFITGCIKYGEPRDALTMYKKVQEDILHLDGPTYVALLKACVDLKDLETGCQIHDKIRRDGLLQNDIFLCNKLIDLYAKCSSISKMQDVFDRLVVRDIVSWNSLIAGYLIHNHGRKALDCFEKLQLNGGYSPNAITLVHCLKACVITEAASKGRQVHSEIVRKGYFEKDHFVGNALVDLYAKSGSLEDARQVFEKLAVRNVVSWTALIAGYVKQQQDEEALNCFEQMELEGVSPNSVTFVCVLKACGNTGCIAKGTGIHDGIVKEGLLETNLLVGNALVNMYAECGLPAKAFEVFDKLPVRDVLSWNALIGGYLKSECDEEALSCFIEMQDKGVSPNAITFVCGLKASGSLGAIDVGREIHVEVVRKGLLERDIVVGNAMVNMYANCGLLARAQEVFDILPSRTVVSWTSLIAEYVKFELAVEALKCLEQMEQEGFHPNAVTFSCSLKACGLIMDIEKGRYLHAEVERKGLVEGDLDIGNGLTDMYARCGFLADAQEMFDKLSVRSIISWNALVVGYAVQECGATALNCFEKMELDGISPDAITFVYSLKACGSIGDRDKARDLHALIVQRGLLENTLFVGTSLVETYSKFGMLEEAQEVFGTLPVRDVALWTSLIAGYANNEYVEKALICFEHMQGEGVFPNAATWVCILKACGSGGNLTKGSDVHAEIARIGLMETDLAVGNVLVDMYTKLGLFAKAQEVVDKLSIRDVVTWNALIAGYAKHELREGALNCFEQMQQEGVQPNSVTFICILNACGSFEATGKSIEIHSEIARRGLLDIDQVVGSALINFYAQCDLLAKAHEVSDRLPVRDVTSWTALIGGYAKHEHGGQALICYEQMQLEGFVPNAVTFICTLKACGTIGASDKGKQIHAGIAFEGMFMRDLVVGNALVHMYAKCGSLAIAQEVFDKLPLRDTVSWNALIAEYSNCGLSEEVLFCYERMQLEGVPPNAVTFACSLKACGCTGAADKGREIHAEVLKQHPIEMDLMVCTALVCMYVRCGLLAKAQEVFDMLPVRDTATWTALIAGCVDHDSGEDAMHHFEQMLLEGTTSYSATSTFSSRHCGGVVDTKDSQKVQINIAGKKVPNRNLIVGSMLVDMYAKSGSLAEAKKVFDKLGSRDVVLWTALMAGYFRHNHIEEALNCYDWMQLEGVSPDPAALVCSLKACGSIGAVEKGRELHAEIARRGLLEINPVVGNALVDMYAKCGSLGKAQEVFDQLPVSDVVTWTSLISGYAKSGHSDRVFTIFETMRREGKNPDLVAFLKVLDACSRADVLDKAQLYIEIMQKEYAMSPGLEHYNCMVDLVGRAGNLAKAEAIIKEMPFHPDLVVWHTIMGACQKWGNADIGRKVFEHVLPPDEKHGSYKALYM